MESKVEAPTVLETYLVFQLDSMTSNHYMKNGLFHHFHLLKLGCLGYQKSIFRTKLPGSFMEDIYISSNIFHQHFHQVLPSLKLTARP